MPMAEFLLERISCMHDVWPEVVIGVEVPGEDVPRAASTYYIYIYIPLSARLTSRVFWDGLIGLTNLCG